jgi:hypothetical protein
VVSACDIGHGSATFPWSTCPQGARPSIAALLAMGVAGVSLIIAALRDCTRDTTTAFWLSPCEQLLKYCGASGAYSGWPCRAMQAR